MDSKEIKTTLKNAREAIRQKDFKEALKQCKAILTADKNHYMALVLVAVACEGLEQHEQSLKAYKRAIEADPQQSLALQGLSTYYEKNPGPENKTDLQNVYQRLIDVYSGDEEKRVEVIKKLANLYVTNSNTEKAAQLYQELLTVEKDADKRQKIQETLISVLETSTDPTCKEKLVSVCETMIQSLTEEDVLTEKVINIYLAARMKQCDESFRTDCDAVIGKHATSVAALQYLLISILDSKLGQPKRGLDDEETEKLNRLVGLTTADDNYTVSVLKGYQTFCAGDLIQARELISIGLKKCDLFASAYAILCLVKFRLHDNEGVLQTSSYGLKVLQRKYCLVSVPRDQVHRTLCELKVRALLEQGTVQSLDMAVSTIEQDLESSCERMKVLQGLIYLKQGNIGKAEECVVGVSAACLSLQGRIAVLKNQLDVAVERFKKAVDMEPSCSEHLLDLAKCLWKMGDSHSECQTALLKAAKADPYNSEVFLYLGHFYSQTHRDTVRARKCYQKSFDLDPNNDEAGTQLCDLMTETGDDEAAHTLLANVTEKANAGCAKWAWLRLGLYQIKHEDPTVAAASLQSALRADPTDNHVWECLAEAYYQRGSYTASLKAFTKASELEPESMYCLFQIAAIKQTLGQYPEAIEEYKLILDRSPDYVPALKGVGETYLLQARSLLRDFMNGRARDTAQKAILHLTRAVSHRPDLSCLWKLMGDSCTILHVLPTQLFGFQVSARLVKKDQLTSDEIVTINKLETLQLGGRCYGKALKILPECSSLWHDLGLNYFRQSRCCDVADIKLLANRCVQALKKAISLEPGNHKHWNALGVVCCFEGCYKPALAQHCFIKSVQAEANNVVAWTNLATLYLKNDNLKLAHEAFKVAQSLEPSYVACWIGQAMIAEIVGDEDAMDLFRHTTELGNHLEAALGYGHWVCSMLQNMDRKKNEMYRYAIEQMSAIPAASDVLARYIDRVQTNAKAYNMHGLLLEHQKLYQTARDAFSRAVSLLEEDSGNNEELQDVRCNYARVLCKCGQFTEAVDMFSQAGEVSEFNDLCQLALALYKLGELEKSFQAYTKAASLATTDADKSHVLAAIAMVSYKFGDKEGTKTALFQSSQQTQPSPWGLEALCAFGLLQADITLATAAVQELLQIGDTDSHRVHMLKLAIALCIAQGDMNSAKYQIQRHLHKNPGQASLWQLLSGLLLQFFPQYGQAAVSAAQCAEMLDRNTSRENMIQKCTGQLIAGLHGIKNGHHNNALSSAQRLVHLYPDKIENLVSLATALHGEAMLTEKPENRQKLLQEELTYLRFIISCDIKLELQLWSCKQMVVCALQAGQHNVALEIMEKVMTEFGASGDTGVFFEVFKNVLQKNASALSAVVANSDTFYYWQILLELYTQTGLKQEVKQTLQKCLQAEQFSSNQPVILSNLLKLLHFSFCEYMTGRDDVRKQTFVETAKQVMQLDPDCVPALLMQAVVQFEDNARLSKHLAQGVLSRCHEAGTRGHDLSLARRLLITILHNSKKDPETVQSIVSEAEDVGDQATVLYYKQLTGVDVS